MHPFTVLFCIALLASSSYALGRMQGGWGWRRGYRRGFRDGNQDGQAKSIRDAVTLARSVAEVQRERVHLHPSVRNARGHHERKAPRPA